MNPYPSPSVSSTLSSLNDLITLSNHVLSITPSPPTLKSNLVQCPFNPHHLVPPHSLFLHHLRCPSSPRPLPLHHFTHSLTYPQTLHHSPSDQLSFYLDSLSNFFYRDCPAVVPFSPAHAPTLTPSLTLPSFLSLHDEERVFRHAPILPSHYFSVARELQSWNDFPVTYSKSISTAVSGLVTTNDRDLTEWIISNSPRYGVIIDAAMQHHIYLLCCLCLKAILRETCDFAEKQNSNSHVDCPVFNQALTWLASQVSILYGGVNGKAFVLDFVKKCILVGASALLLVPLEDEGDLKPESQKGAEPDVLCGENENCIVNRKISESQVAAAVSALYERALLEQKIKGFWFSQQPSNYQLVAEHSYLSAKANEERTKRPDYRPLIDHDGLHRQQSSNQETSREKTREEVLAEERDYKRRRMSYRGKKTNQSPVQVMRYMIEDFMEQIKQAGGFESCEKLSEESGLFSSEPAVDANSLRKVSHGSPEVTISDPRHCEQESCDNSYNKNKTVDDAFPREYKQQKHENHRNHYHREAQRNTDRGKHHRDRPSTSPERYSSHSRLHENRSHHNKHDNYSNRKKYDNSSRVRDKWEMDTHRNHFSDSSRNNAFSDRYDPSESFDNCEDDISSDAKYIKSDKYYDKECY